MVIKENVKVDQFGELISAEQTIVKKLTQKSFVRSI